MTAREWLEHHYEMALKVEITFHKETVIRIMDQYLEDKLKENDKTKNRPG